MSDSPSVNQPSSQAVASPKEPGVGRGCLTVVVVAVVLGVIVTLAAGAGQSKPPVESAGSYIAAHGSIATTVRVAATDVRLALGRSAGDQSRRKVEDRLLPAATSARASLAIARPAFATKPVTGTVGDAEVEVFAAVGDLDAAVTAIASQARGATPATLSGLTSQYEDAVGEWNDGVRVIWRAGGRSTTAPTIP
jgi:hypothetical protein